MKLPSRSQLERELARLKRAAIRLHENSAPGNSPSHPSLFSSFWNNCRLAAHFFRRRFFPSRPRSRLHKPRLQSLLSPHDFARVIQVVGEEPKFFNWFMHLKNLSLDERKRELERMTAAMRIDPDNDEIATILDHLHSPAIFEGFCQALLAEHPRHLTPTA